MPHIRFMVVSLSVMLALSATVAVAQTTRPASESSRPLLAGPDRDRDKDPTTTRGFSGQNMGGNRKMAEFEKALTQLDLTDQQREAIDKAIADHAGKVRYNNDRVYRLRNEVTKAEEAGDQAKVKDLRAQIKELQNARPTPEHLIYRLQDILTRRQHIELFNNITAQAPWEAANKVEFVVSRSDLTPEQIARISELTRQYRIDVAAYRAERIDELVELRIQTASNDKQLAKQARVRVYEIGKAGPVTQYLREVAKVFPADQRRAFWDTYKSAQDPRKIKPTNNRLDL